MEISHVAYKYTLKILRNIAFKDFFFSSQSERFCPEADTIVFCVCWKWLLANTVDSHPWCCMNHSASLLNMQVQQHRLINVSVLHFL